MGNIAIKSIIVFMAISISLSTIGFGSAIDEHALVYSPDSSVIATSVINGSTSISLPSGGSVYLYAGASGGGNYIFSNSPIISDLNVTDSVGYQGVTIGHSYSNVGAFSTPATYYVVGGTEINTANFIEYTYYSNQGNSVQGSFNVSKDSSLAVIVAGASNNFNPILSGPFSILAQNSSYSQASVLIATATLSSGTHSFSLNYTQGPGNPGDTSIGIVIYIFTPTTPHVPGKYYVTFYESGLPSGSEWTINLNGVTHNITQSSTQYLMGNGTYSYQISSSTGYVPSPSSGKVVVNGANVYVTISFSSPPPPNPSTISILYSPIFAIAFALIAFAAILTVSFVIYRKGGGAL